MFQASGLDDESPWRAIGVGVHDSGTECAGGDCSGSLSCVRLARTGQETEHPTADTPRGVSLLLTGVYTTFTSHGEVAHAIRARRPLRLPPALRLDRPTLLARALAGQPWRTRRRSMPESSSSTSSSRWGGRSKSVASSAAWCSEWLASSLWAWVGQVVSISACRRVRFKRYPSNWTPRSSGVWSACGLSRDRITSLRSGTPTVADGGRSAENPAWPGESSPGPRPSAVRKPA